MRFGGLEWGWGGLVLGQGLSPRPLPGPLGQLLPRQLILQLPVFRRPHRAGVGGAQGGSRPPVFFGLCGLLLHLHLVTAAERMMWVSRGLLGPLTQMLTEGCPQGPPQDPTILEL